MASPVQRIAWLDHARALSMAAVVLFHTPPRHPIWDFAVLFNIGVPLFFFFSGLLFNTRRHRDFLPFVRHRCRQLLVPYLCFTAVFYLLWLVAGRRLDDPAVAWWEPLAQTVTGYPHTVIAPFWFVTCLFSMQVIHWLLLRALRDAWWVVGASVALWAMVGVMPDIWMWNVRRALLYLPLYALANALRPRLLSGNASTICPTTGAAVAALAGVAALYGSGLIEDTWLSRQCATAASIAVIPAMVCVSMWMARRWGALRVTTVIAANGITYLALQNYVIGVIKLVHDIRWWERPIAALAVMAVIYPISLFIERHLPWMLGRGPLFDQHH